MKTPACMSACTLFHDYRNRDCVDLSGNGNDGVMNLTQWVGRGISFPEDASVINVLDSPELQTTEGCLVVYGPFHSQIGYEKFINKRDAGGKQFDWYANATRLTFYDSSVFRSLTLDIKGSKYNAVNYKTTETPEGFQDGVSVGNYDGTVTVSVNDAPIDIGGSTQFASSPCKSMLQCALMFNRKLTALEHAELYSYLTSLRHSTKTFSRIKANIQVDPNESGLVAGWDMKPVDGQVIDVSGNGNDGTIDHAVYEKTPLGDSLSFRGSLTGNVDCGSGISLSDATFAFWFKSPFPAGERKLINYYQNASNAWGVNVDGNGNVEINNDIDDANATLYSTLVEKNTWNFVVSVLDNKENKLYINGELVGSGTMSSSNLSGVSGTLYLMSRHSTTGFAEGNLVAPQVFNVAKDQTWVSKQYNKGKQALFHTDYGANVSPASVTSGQLENTPFIVDSGSFKISTDTINNETVKVIECVTAGKIFLLVNYLDQTDSEAAYGTWNFWWRKADTSAFTCSICTDLISSLKWNLIHNSDETVDLREETTVRIDGGATTYAADTWHQAKVTRSAGNEFELFINGTSLGTVTDSDTPTSVGIVFDMDDGDKISLGTKQGRFSLVKEVV